MNAERRMSTCAPSVGGVAWHEINWADCYKTVGRLQARIVKASREGKPGKIKALQWLLTHSFAAKALAVRRVTENQGKKTPGVDGITWSSPAAKTEAMKSLHRRGYRAKPLRRVYIPKANGKLRPLGIPTMKDRAMQAIHKLALEPIAEMTADHNSYGFRPMRCAQDAYAQCVKTLYVKASAQWILEGDIKGCFDNISHAWLLENIPMDKQVLKKWLKAGYIERHNFNATEDGTPQGGIISPILANMTLDGLETLLNKHFFMRSENGKRRNLKVNMIRYADDFIITGESKELLEKEVKPMVVEFLAARGLKLSERKTKITHIEEGFDFLGWNFRKYDNGKFLAKPSRKNTAAFLQKAKDVIQANKTAKQENLIGKLNPLITGWVNYHKHAVAKEVFAGVDDIIWRRLWRWARRRHPQKTKTWVKDRYFQPIKGRKWAFSAKRENKLPIVLRKAADTAIVRHIKIIGEANPFDPRFDSYFDQKLGTKMAKELNGRRRLLTIWNNQNGICPKCGQKITKETGWHLHHINPRREGGPDTMSNLELQHGNCHMQTHHSRGKKFKIAGSQIASSCEA